MPWLLLRTQLALAGSTKWGPFQRLLTSWRLFVGHQLRKLTEFDVFLPFLLFFLRSSPCARRSVAPTEVTWIHLTLYQTSKFFFFFFANCRRWGGCSHTSHNESVTFSRNKPLKQYHLYNRINGIREDIETTWSPVQSERKRKQLREILYNSTNYAQKLKNILEGTSDPAVPWTLRIKVLQRLVHTRFKQAIDCV